MSINYLLFNESALLEFYAGNWTRRRALNDQEASNFLLFRDSENVKSTDADFESSSGVRRPGSFLLLVLPPTSFGGRGPRCWLPLLLAFVNKRIIIIALFAANERFRRDRSGTAIKSGSGRGLRCCRCAGHRCAQAESNPPDATRRTQSFFERSIDETAIGLE